MAAQVESTPVTTAGVEVLSIIANKQKTKHFLENRIQADLSAAENSSTTTSTSSSRDSTTSTCTTGVDPSSAPSSGPSSVQSSPVCPSRVAGRRSRMSAPLNAPGPSPADPGWRRSSVDAAPETRIAREIREQRCREEEFRRLRTAAGPASPAGGQEEPLSGYGSEEKDSLTEEGDSSSRGPCRPLSRSQESLSSGHSSGLGSDHTATETAAGRQRRVIVRPYEDEDDEERWSEFARSTETPIEREIRLTREREEERRREQALRAPKPAVITSRPQPPQSRRPAPAPAPEDHRQAALRLATGRVQHEIQEATRRELELRGEGHTITTSEETVDDKVTRLGDMTDHSRQVRQQWSEPSRRPTPASPSRPARRPPPRPAQTAAAAAPAAAAAAAPAPAQTAFRPSAPAGRGLMAKFISSRGKLRPAGAFVTSVPSPPQPQKKQTPPPLAQGVSLPERSSPPVGGLLRGAGSGGGAPAVRRGPRSEQAPVQRRLQTCWSLDNPAVSSGTHSTERRVSGGSGGAGNRRLLTAEEKIQLELKVMKEREDELRRERSWTLARSQPDLLAALGEAEDHQQQEEEDDVPAPGPLTRTMSNPNLLDDQQQIPGGLSGGRRRSGLIDQWESRIQGTKH